MNSSWEIASWYAVLLVLTWGIAPWVRLLARHLPDSGASIARPLALLASVYPLWLLASLDLLPYSTTGLWISWAILSMSGWWIAFHHHLVSRDWLRALLVAELAAVAAFGLYVWLRGYTPDITGTEKPMDVAFLSSSSRAVSMPPTDPWFAGRPINYYYLGYLLHGSVARLAAVPTSIGFNLALATTFSMAFVAAGGLAFNAVRRWLNHWAALVSGALASVLLVLVGNLYAAQRLVVAPEAAWNAWWWDKKVGVGWRASRIVCDGPRIANDCKSPSVETINEFPFFSFLLGDLHPHVMALPFTVVALSLALNLLTHGDQGGGRRGWREGVILVASGAAVGALYPLNSWDYPTFLIIALAASWFAWRRFRLRHRLIALGTLIAASILAWLPFFLTFVPPVGSSTGSLRPALRDIPLVSTLAATLGTVTGERTSVGEFLTVFGVPFLVAVSLIVTGFAQRADSDSDGWSPGGAGVLLVGAGLAALLLPAPVILLCAAPIVGGAELLRRRRTVDARFVALALYVAGFLLLLPTEFFFLRDVFNSRMNTLFKVYYQVWTLFAVATALSAVVLWREYRPRSFGRFAISGIFATALAAGLAYPVVASYQWTDGFAGPRDLDGAAYVGNWSPDELAAIRWLRDHAGPHDVLVEAGCSYSYKNVDGVPVNRASAFSGVPAVAGWGGHQRQWRNGEPGYAEEIDQRLQDARAILESPSGPLLDRYGVTLLYVGTFEREGARGCKDAEAEPVEATAVPGYPGPGWQEVFTTEDVQIYRRAAAARADQAH